MARAALGLGVFLALCFGAGALGSLFTSPSIPTWYAELKRPVWTPPNWLFGPVWTALYLMMGVAGWLVWRQAGVSGAAWALALFGLQLALNVLWAILFFGMRSPGVAFGEIVVLWVAIAGTLAAFWRVSPTAGVLLVPYLLWVSFATALNLSIWRLNR
jgi:tryptophan-rich sensory protein